MKNRRNTELVTPHTVKSNARPKAESNGAHGTAKAKNGATAIEGNKVTGTVTI